MGANPRAEVAKRVWGVGIGAFADELLAAREDVGERLEEALQLRPGSGGRELHGDGPPGELDLDGDGGRRGLHYLSLYRQSRFCLASALFRNNCRRFPIHGKCTFSAVFFFFFFFYLSYIFRFS